MRSSITKAGFFSIIAAFVLSFAGLAGGSVGGFLLGLVVFVLSIVLLIVGGSRDKREKRENEVWEDCKTYGLTKQEYTPIDKARAELVAKKHGYSLEKFLVVRDRLVKKQEEKKRHQKRPPYKQNERSYRKKRLS